MTRRLRRLTLLLLIAISLAPPLLATPAARASAMSLILINEFMPRPSSGNPEWVELYNAGPVDVDVSGWKIDNAADGGILIPVPAGSILQSNSLLVITRTGDILGIADTIRLFDAHGGIVESHAYFGALTGKSFARVPDGSDLWQIGGSAEYPQAHT